MPKCRHERELMARDERASAAAARNSYCNLVVNANAHALYVVTECSRTLDTRRKVPPFLPASFQYQCHIAHMVCRYDCAGFTRSCPAAVRPVTFTSWTFKRLRGFTVTRPRQYVSEAPSRDLQHTDIRRTSGPCDPTLRIPRRGCHSSFQRLPSFPRAEVFYCPLLSGTLSSKS